MARIGGYFVGSKQAQCTACCTIPLICDKAGDLGKEHIEFFRGWFGSCGDDTAITNVNLTEDLFYEVSGTGSNYKKIADPRQ